MDLIGREIAGCRLVKLLGKGGIGAVYEGVHTTSQQAMAVKILTDEARAIPQLADRFEREARLCYQLDHPNLVKVHTWGKTDDGVVFIAMEYVRGATLERMIRSHGHLTWEVASAVVADIAEALQHVHDLDIVHRDIKPANILVDRDGRGVLADLGLARQMVDGLDESTGRRLTAPGSAIGSPAFMAPEQIVDTSTVGPAADLYSLGATLYCAIAGRAPLVANTPSGTITRVMHDLPMALGEVDALVPTAISELVDSCLQKDPVARPASAGLFASMLRDELRAAGYAGKPETKRVVRRAEA